MKEYPPGEQPDFIPDFDNPSPSHFRVLVADDNDVDRRLTIWHLSKAWPVQQDMRVDCAADGDEALEKIRNQPYALVVLDWNMPQRDGGEVLRTMRDDGSCVPVIVVSGQRREAIPSDLQAMAATFVNKNELNPARFRQAIATSLQFQERGC